MPFHWSDPKETAEMCVPPSQKCVATPLCTPVTQDVAWRFSNLFHHTRTHTLPSVYWESAVNRAMRVVTRTLLWLTCLPADVCGYIIRYMAQSLFCIYMPYLKQLAVNFLISFTIRWHIQYWESLIKPAIIILATLPKVRSLPVVPYRRAEMESVSVTMCLRTRHSKYYRLILVFSFTIRSSVHF